MLNPLSNVIGISMSSSMEAEFILAVAPPIIFKICFPFRNSFQLNRSPIFSFGWPFTILVFISGPVKTVSDRYNTPSLMPASAMFDLRKNILKFAGNRTAEIKKNQTCIFIFFGFFRSADRRNNFFLKYCLMVCHIQIVVLWSCFTYYITKYFKHSSALPFPKILDTPAVYESKGELFF